MKPTGKRDLAVAVVVMGVVSFVLIPHLYRYFPPISWWAGISLCVVAIAEAGWAHRVRTGVSHGDIGVGPGRLHPLLVARTVVIAQASAWVSAVMLGWWLAVAFYVVPRRTELRVAAADTPGVLLAVLSAVTLLVAALWLQHCCLSPHEPGDEAGSAG